MIRQIGMVMIVSEYIKGDAILPKLIEYYKGYGNVPLELESLIDDIPDEPVVECAEILKVADDQERIGYIQTAQVLRKLVNDNE